MGIVRCYAAIARALHRNPDLLQQELPTIAAQYDDYAYIGDRRDLADDILQRAARLRDRLRSDARISTVDLPGSDDADTWAQWWFGRKQWRQNSGAYPDFVLGTHLHNPFGNGGLLELKDSKGSAIASFNSTLPTAAKRLEELTPLVVDSLRRYDLPLSTDATYPHTRHCFYLIRTHKHQSAYTRLSIVHGTFFETLPIEQLLKEVWRQVLAEAGATSILTAETLEELLAQLGTLRRENIAISRHIQRASIKPRLRIMSEIEAPGNPHTYSDIVPRSVNLIVKPPSLADTEPHRWIHDATEWLAREANMDGVEFIRRRRQLAHTRVESFMRFEDYELPVAVLPLKHERNGMHVVVQMQLHK